MTERISIVLVNYNRLKYLQGTVESIFENTGYPYELIIWDNGSTEPGVREYLGDLQANEENYVQVIFNDKNIGVWRASNELICRAASRETLGIVKLDNDCIIKTKGWLTKWIECCQANAQVGMLAANIEGKKERSPDTEVLELNGHQLLALTEEGTGGAVYIPGRTFRQFGFYNEEYGLYGHADKDYAKRVMLQGMFFAYHRAVEIERFAVNSDDQTGGYRDHKNLYVRRNRKLYVLNRYLYQKKLKSRAIWYKKYEQAVPEEVLADTNFSWAKHSSAVHVESGKVSSRVRQQLAKHRLTHIKK